MRTLSAALLLFAATSVQADWVKLAESGDTTYYVDPATVVDAGGVRRAWIVHDYARPQPGGVRSRRVAYEINCAGERLRSVAVTEHAQPMSQGQTLNAWERQSDWLYVAPRTGSNVASRTPYRAIVKFICAR